MPIRSCDDQRVWFANNRFSVRLQIQRTGILKLLQRAIVFRGFPQNECENFPCETSLSFSLFVYWRGGALCFRALLCGFDSLFV